MNERDLSYYYSKHTKAWINANSQYFENKVLELRIYI